LLEQVEDAQDLKTLKAMRKRPLKFRKLDDFLKAAVVYDVLIERTAERDLKSLPTAVFARIVPRIKAPADNPLGSDRMHKLAGSKSDWRIRIGDYRSRKHVKSSGFGTPKVYR
jgi:mRNA interferase RelE/StbE